MKSGKFSEDFFLRRKLFFKLIIFSPNLVPQPPTSFFFRIWNEFWNQQNARRFIESRGWQRGKKQTFVVASSFVDGKTIFFLVLHSSWTFFAAISFDLNKYAVHSFLRTEAMTQDVFIKLHTLLKSYEAATFTAIIVFKICCKSMLFPRSYFCRNVEDFHSSWVQWKLYFLREQ